MNKCKWKKNTNLSMGEEFQVFDKENERGYYTDRMFIQKTRLKDGKIIWATGNSVLRGSVFKNKKDAVKDAKLYMRNHRGCKR